MPRPLSAGAVILCLSLAAWLAACSNAQPAPATPADVPTPEAGRATVIGRLVDSDSGQPYVNTIVRLGEVIHAEPNDSGAWFIDDARSPGDYTDDQGNFVIVNVEPKEYVVVVGDFQTRYAVVTEAPDRAQVWVISADDVFDLGRVEVALP